MRNCFYSLVLAFACTPWVGARAQSAQGEAVAEALFRSGQALMKEGKVQEACEKFSASYQVDPALGTLLNLAVCHEKAGKTASAWSEFSDVVTKGTQAGQADRVAFAKARIRALEPKLLRFVVTVVDPSPDLSVRIDGNLLPRAAWGAASPMDPGAHVVEASQPNRKPWTSSLKVSAEQPQALRRLEIPPLEVLPLPPPPSPPLAGPRLEPTPSPLHLVATPVAEVTATSPAKATGWIACGTAVLAVGGGAFALVEGLSAKGQYDQAAALLKSSPVQTDTGIASYNRLIATGNTANGAAWIGGGAGAAAAVVTGVLGYLSYKQTGEIGPFRF